VFKTVKKAKEAKGKAENAKTIEMKLGRLAKGSVKSALKVQGKVHKRLDSQAGDGWLPPKASFSEVAAKKKVGRCETCNSKCRTERKRCKRQSEGNFGASS